MAKLLVSCSSALRFSYSSLLIPDVCLREDLKGVDLNVEAGARHNKKIADGIRILYGGSVKADNAHELFEMADIDGGLIGGASLVAKDFLSICHAVRK